MKLLNQIILYGFFITGVILLFYNTGRISTMLTAFGSFIVSILLAWLLKIKKIGDRYWFFINLALVFNLCGEIIIYYSGLFFYDKLLHFFLGLLLTSIIYEYYANNSELKKDAVVVTVIGLLAIWEIYEYCVDIFFGFQSQGVVRNGIFVQSRIDDTMFDLIWGALGSLSYLFFKKEKIDVTIKKDYLKVKTLVKKKEHQIHLKTLIKQIFNVKF